MAHDYGADPSTLIDGLRHKVYRLEDLSFSFERRWNESNVAEYQLISLKALDMLMAVSAGLLPQARIRAEIAQRADLAGWSAFLEDVGHWTGPLPDMSQFKEVFDQPLGSAQLPKTLPRDSVSLYHTLNSLVRALLTSAEQNYDFLGFRFEGNQHMLLVGVAGSDESALGILEFDVRLFCTQCLFAISEI